MEGRKLSFQRSPYKKDVKEEGLILVRTGYSEAFL
jgi:hypothetical protein